MEQQKPTSVDNNDEEQPAQKPLEGRARTIAQCKLFGGAALFLLMVFYLAFFGFRSLDKGVGEIKNGSNLRIYDIYLRVASRTADSATKTDFIDYTTKAIEDKIITPHEKLMVESKYSTLLIENPEVAKEVQF